MFRLLPWRMIVRKAARRYGLADPAMLLARIRNFSQPSEVKEPIELLRAGFHFHARGLVNSRAIQNNLDWVWPYWVQRQFDPADDAFVPRAFSFSHINLTNRNWTAVGHPQLSLYPIVDPRGLVTPLLDGWSLDCWMIDAEGSILLPSRLHDDDVEQTLQMHPNLAVQTVSWEYGMSLRQTVELVIEEGEPLLLIRLDARASSGSSLIVAVRPYNPEGIQFIDSVESLPDEPGWLVNGATKIITSLQPNRVVTSHYDHGDLVHRIRKHEGEVVPNQSVSEVCDQGMATAASVFDMTGTHLAMMVRVPLQRERKALGNPSVTRGEETWESVLKGTARLNIPDERANFLYEASLHTLILLSAEDVVPGPYTYRRFWFRDACLMMNAMLAAGLTDRCLRMIERFPGRQCHDGYFKSQEGEWDSNGQVLWILNRYRMLSHSVLPKEVLRCLGRAVRWLDEKRCRPDAAERHAGLLPAGFSAEHLGPNDYYYWDDFWAQAGLQAAAEIWTSCGEHTQASEAQRLAGEFAHSIDQSLRALPADQATRGIPASPYRRMDSGAIGSLVADYPLQLRSPHDPQIQATVRHLMANHFFKGGFFQDMVHSGINAYLTLQIAQTLLRHDDPAWEDLFRAIRDLASPTGQWPEAIHPRTTGGCMGDGQHGWAAAEWVMLLRNCFVREEAGRLIIGSGISASWLRHDKHISFGPTATPWGQVTIHISCPQSNPCLRIETLWHSVPCRIDVRIPSFEQIDCVTANSAISLQPRSSDGEPSFHSSEEVSGVRQ